jgi:hypothetical protein
MTEAQARTDRYVSSGLPAETAQIMVAYEMSYQGMTSTLAANGERVPA